MDSLLKSVDLLGRQIESELRVANGDLRQLPEIAACALADFSDLDGVSLGALAKFISQTSIPQQPKNPFSDLPVTIYTSRDFYIEILVWSHATTAIHQHGFGGAFRVVGGSSIHTKYCFEKSEEITSDLLFGRVKATKSEYLSVSSVRRIDPGMTGLVHSLYHLDNPSASLVIRDRGHVAFGPQYSYFPPLMAIHQLALEKDHLTSMFARLIELTGRINRSTLMSIWCNHIACFEFPRLAWLYIKYCNYLEHEERAVFRDAAKKAHGALIDQLFDCADYYANRKTLSRMRERIDDTELRFFLALLMNVPKRADLLRMVAERYPRCDPVNRCADWLMRLSVDEKSAQERMREVVQILESKGLGAMQFSRQLRQALPVGIGGEDAQVIFREFISGEFKSENLPEHSLEALLSLPQLSVLREGIP